METENYLPKPFKTGGMETPFQNVPPKHEISKGLKNTEPLKPTVTWTWKMN